MNYRIGNQCFGSKEAATDYQMSQVLPVITADGKLQHPVKNGEVWQYAGQTVKLDFPQCDPAAEFGQGAAIGGAIGVLLAMAYGIRQLCRFIYDSFSEPEKGADA